MLQRSIYELCNVEKDRSWKRDLGDSTHNDKDSPFRRVVCYECAKGENEEWKLHVEGYGPRLVHIYHQYRGKITLLALREALVHVVYSMHKM